jgi:hypothetical protein
MKDDQNAKTDTSRSYNGFMTDIHTIDALRYAPGSKPFGRTYAEWTAKWWQWILSIPADDNPARDMDGTLCGINQSGPVWFLAGTLGGNAERSCTIPSGKSILLPVLNYGATLADEPAIKTEEELLSLSKLEMDVISDIRINLDGVELYDLQKYRVPSVMFDVNLPENNLFGGNQGPTRGVSDGYWLFLKPLSKGKHEIRSFGSCLDGRVNIGVRYHINIDG